MGVYADAVYDYTQDREYMAEQLEQDTVVLVLPGYTFGDPHSVSFLRALWNDIERWVGEVSPDDTWTFQDTAAKAQEELREFVADPIPEEAADVFLSLVIACQQVGIDADAFIQAVQDKHVVNQQRTWERLPDGTVHHV